VQREITNPQNTYSLGFFFTPLPVRALLPFDAVQWSKDPGQLDTAKEFHHRQILYPAGWVIANKSELLALSSHGNFR
jgi:hypothetical protein